jgi:putative membrane protein
MRRRIGRYPVKNSGSKADESCVLRCQRLVCQASVVIVAASLIALVSPANASAHDDSTPVSELGSAWQFSAPLIVGLAIALLLFAQAYVRLRRRGRSDHANWARPVLFGLGIAVLAFALFSPLDAIGEEYLFSAHMLQHVLIADVAPALIIVALRGPLTFFFLPPQALRFLAAREWLRRLLGLLLRPKLAFAIWVVVMGGWHVPLAYDFALANAWAHYIEHFSFVVAGTLVWAQLIDPARRYELALQGRALFAVALFAAGHVVIHPALFSSGPIYRAYAEQDERLLGLSPLSDQYWGGAVMTIEQVLTLGTFLIILLWPHVRTRGQQREHPDPGRTFSLRRGHSRSVERAGRTTASS